MLTVVLPVYLFFVHSIAFNLCNRDCKVRSPGSVCNVDYGYCIPPCSSHADCEAAARTSPIARLQTARYCDSRGFCTSTKPLLGPLSLDLTAPPLFLADLPNELETSFDSEEVEIASPIDWQAKEDHDKERFDGIVGDTDWHKIQTTWSADPMAGYYDVPDTQSGAEQNGWTKIMDINHVKSPGNVYIDQYFDMAALAIYNADGKISGMIIGIEKVDQMIIDNPSQFEFLEYTLSEIANDVVRKGLVPRTFYGVTAFFRDPNGIKVKGSSSHTTAPLIGDRLWIPYGYDQNMERQFTLFAPLTEAMAKSTQNNEYGFEKGGCLFQTGFHWFKHTMSGSMDCHDQFPVFWIFRDGKLSGFGVILAYEPMQSAYELNGARWEHPSNQKTGPMPQIFGPNGMPKCFKGKHVTMQHIFFNNPTEWMCPPEFHI